VNDRTTRSQMFTRDGGTSVLHSLCTWETVPVRHLLGFSKRLSWPVQDEIAGDPGTSAVLWVWCIWDIAESWDFGERPNARWEW